MLPKVGLGSHEPDLRSHLRLFLHSFGRVLWRAHVDSPAAYAPPRPPMPHPDPWACDNFSSDPDEPLSL